jgi:signal recognition particle receptor subunit beta
VDEDQPGVEPTVLKIVIAGPFGVGKTTLVRAVSEIEPVSTEEFLTEASTGTDVLLGVEDKTTTTVAMDFGRITFPGPEPMVLMLFGTPGQERYRFTWEDLAYGAVGALILVDTRRLADSFDSLDYFERRAVPFVLAVNEFADAPYRYTLDEVRAALHLPPEVPVIDCDARSKPSVRKLLIRLVEYAHTSALQGVPQ